MGSRSTPPPARSTRKPTRGGRLLTAYIDRHYGGNKAAFGRDAGLTRLAVFRVTDGVTEHVSVDIAIAIVRATKGKPGGNLKVEDFLSSTVDEEPAAAA